MDSTLRSIADCRCQNAEGPLWHPDEGRLYWTDIPGKRLYRTDTTLEAFEVVFEGEQIGGYTIQDDGSLLMFGEDCSIRCLKDGVLHTLIDFVEEERGTRFNDVIADPEGRVFCGTMPMPGRAGHLYRLDPDGSMTAVLSGLTVSNGLGFSPDLAALYHTDSDMRTIMRYPYDRASGALGEGELFAQVNEGAGVPDGMTVDVEGFVWSGHWNGGVLVRYDPDGREVARIDFPARKVTCPSFGGPDYEDLFVTTAGGDNREEEGPGAGRVYQLRPGVRGRPEFRSRIEIPGV
ncbi:MAG: SMP-30/gluconolactonase/LRE family protein [Chloroflexi bacterium]|nr:SMP-30/gluconolactonase/LRE family protein [Chloroflexota bacterium]